MRFPTALRAVHAYVPPQLTSGNRSKPWIIYTVSFGDMSTRAAIRPAPHRVRRIVLYRPEDPS